LDDDDNDSDDIDEVATSLSSSATITVDHHGRQHQHQVVQEENLLLMMKLNINNDTLSFVHQQQSNNWSTMIHQEVPITTMPTQITTTTTIHEHQQQLIAKEEKQKTYQCQWYENPMDIIRNPRYLFFIFEMEHGAKNKNIATNSNSISNVNSNNDDVKQLRKEQQSFAAMVRKNRASYL